MKSETLLSLLRIILGFIFAWAFIDKVFGLGFATAPDKSWINGVSPTTGFLKFGTEGIFASFFNSLAGNPLIDWLFMLGLMGVGLSLVLGIGVKIAGYGGAIMMFLIYLSVFPPENNPVIDEHIIYLFLLIFFAKGDMGLRFSFSKRWRRLDIVKKFPILQ